MAELNVVVADERLMETRKGIRYQFVDLIGTLGESFNMSLCHWCGQGAKGCYYAP